MAQQAQTIGVAAPTSHPGLVKSLGLFDSTMLVAGSMIGSGIFIVSADIAHQVQSPGLLLVVWAAAGLMTVIGALSYGELAAAMPHAGGQYVYLRESLGPIWGFLYGWTMLLVIQTATIAAVAIAFAKFTAVIVPWFSASAWIWKIGTFGPWQLWFGSLGPYNVGLNRQNLLAILSIVFLTWVNTQGLGFGKIVQNVFTVAKALSLAALVVLGFWFSTSAARTANFTHFWRNASLSAMHPYPPDHATWMIGTLTLIGVAMVGSLFSMDAWNNITFTAGEVKNPGRDLPLSLIFGTCLVIGLYLLANLAYMRVLPVSGDPNGVTPLARGIEFAPDSRVATAVLAAIFGPAGAVLMAVAILVSTFGCNNGLILSGARIYYAMAKDRLFFAVGRQREPSPRAGNGVDRTVRVGRGSLPLRHLRAAARFSDLRGAHFLYPDAGRSLHAALEPPGNAPSLSRFGLSCAAGPLHRAGNVRRDSVVALQAAVHLAGPHHRSAGDTCLRSLEVGAETGRRSRRGVIV